MRASERVKVLATIDPDAYTATNYLSDAIDMADWHEILVVVMLGTLGTSATIDAEIHESATAAGSYTAITGKAITQLTQAGSDDDKQALINLRNDELGDGKRHVKVSLDVAVATSDAAVIVLGVTPKTSELADLSTVDEIVE